MSNDKIPAGSYICALVTDEDGIVRFPIISGKGGELSIEIELYLYAKDAEQPFATIKQEEVIDASVPARKNTTSTPYDFMVMSLKNLGAESEQAINDAVDLALASDNNVMVFPGQPRAATADVSYKPGNQGGSFMNVKIMPLRVVTDDARARAREAVKQRAAATRPQATPFAARGSQVSPPPVRGGNPFSPPAGR